MHIAKAILWDNDGVLVDTEHLYFRANREILAEIGFELTEELFQRYLLVKNTGVWHLLEERGICDSSSIPVLREKRNQLYSELLKEEPIALPGVKEALQVLASHFRMCVVTSSRRDHFETIHSRTGFLDFFEFSITCDECRETKPHPGPYLTALQRLGIAKEECLIIEDTQRGLLAAQAAGIRCWVVPRGLSVGSDFSAADSVLDSIDDVVSRLLK